MASDYDQLIQSLQRSLPHFSKDTASLSPEEYSDVGTAYGIYIKYWKLLVGDVDPNIVDVQSFHTIISRNASAIEKLIYKLYEKKELEINAEENERKAKEQEASIPPELDSMVAEYRQNQATLEDEEIKSNKQLSVAEQVKMAVAHSKNKQQALTAQEKINLSGKKTKDIDQAIISFGSPKSKSRQEVFAASYKAIEEVAKTYTSFNSLPKNVQQQILDQAVENRSICITNINIAIETAVIGIDSSGLSPEVQKNVSAIASDHIRTVYDVVNSQAEQSANLETQIMENEAEIQRLLRESTKQSGEELEISRLKIKSLTDRNQQYDRKIENFPNQFAIFLKNQELSFEEYEKECLNRLSPDPKGIKKVDLDIDTKTKEADAEILRFYSILKANGVKGKLFFSTDDADLLEKAIRHDMPGLLRLHAGYKAEYTASLINHPITKNLKLSPEAIRLFGKDLTPLEFSQILQQAKNNPNSEIGKLYLERKDIFTSIGSQIRKIAKSPLAKEIAQKKAGPITKAIGKFSDKIGGMGSVVKIIANPYGAFKSMVGRRVGRYAINKIINTAAGKAALAAATKITEQLLKSGIGRAILSIGVKIGAKFGIEIALGATGVGAPLALILVAVDIVITAITFVLKTIRNVVQNTAKSFYGEKIKTRDIIAIPAIMFTGATSVVGGVISFIGGLASATATAAGSATSTIALGILAGFFFYITSIVVAPLISTLVQLESSNHITSSGVGSCSQEVADKAKIIVDNLKPGFWGFYNRSDNYPELFDKALFATNPNLVGIQTDSTFVNLFWCTWLVVKSYSEANSPILVPQLVTHNLTGYFKSQDRYLEASEITIGDICPGMAVFFKIPAGSSTNAHVGIVYSVSPDGFTTVESNASYKEMFYPADESGQFQIINAGSTTIEVSGFGMP